MNELLMFSCIMCICVYFVFFLYLCLRFSDPTFWLQNIIIKVELKWVLAIIPLLCGAQSPITVRSSTADNCVMVLTVLLRSSECPSNLISSSRWWHWWRSANDDGPSLSRRRGRDSTCFTIVPQFYQRSANHVSFFLSWIYNIMWNQFD